MFDDIQKEAIRAESKVLLDNFSRALESVDLENIDEKVLDSGMRRASEVKGFDEDFHDKMFENASNKKGDFIVAERKSW